MIQIIALVGVGAAALLVWHRHNVNAYNAAHPPYLGAPAWPTMGPQIVPDIALPFGIQQEATYYGVSASLLEQYTK